MPRTLSSPEIAIILRGAIRDDDFRRKLLADPYDALRDAGLGDVDPAVLEFFKNLSTGNFDDAVEQLKKTGWNDPIGTANDY